MPTGTSKTDGLASAPAERRHERLALGVALASLAVFAGLAPFAKVQLERLPAFIPLYQSALVIIDFVTAALLFAQCRVAPTRPLLVLACGYLFTALMILAHTLSFPGLFAPQGAIGGGAQTTAWLYMFWHAIFPAFVAAYAVSRPAPIERRQVLGGIAATVIAALALAALAGPGEALLPAVMSGNNYLPAYHAVVAVVWLCSAAALILLWRKRPRTVLDLWAMVVLCVWLCEIALSAMLNQGRFDLGFYAGRIYGLAAASFLLGVLIWETSALHAHVEAASAERAANHAKDEFLAVLGHELRNPLAPIVTALHIMRLRSPGEFVEERGIIERQVSHLTRLVDDLLHISRLTRGVVELRRVRCDARELAARAAELAAPAIEAKRHRLELEVAEGLSLDADGERIVQALCNLLANAAKFADPGCRIRLVAAREGAEVVFRVRDEGQGMSAELLARLFQPFAQGPQSYERAQGGLGLGLAIVRGIAQAHGGRVSAASDGAGRGTEVTLRLPAAAEGAPLQPAAPASRSALAGAPVRVLVVDDNVDAAATVAAVLRLEGMEVHVAHEGREALDAAARIKPTAALLDLGLPHMDGVELAKRLKSLPGLARLRIAALTGYGQAGDRARTASAGFEAHFVKPADAGSLVQFLRATA